MADIIIGPAGFGIREGSVAFLRKGDHLMPCVVIEPDYLHLEHWFTAPIGEWEDSGVHCAHLVRSEEVGTLHLNLTDPTGRAHAAWALAVTIGAGTAGQRTGLMTCHAVPSAEWFQMQGFGTWGAAIAHLDPSNTALLPDGSRRVDAQALQAVCEWQAQR